MLLTSSGVSIIAAGHPYYGRMAFNLAKTIKSVDKDCPIQIITHGNALNHIRLQEQKIVFDYITTAPVINGFECKLNIDLLTNFENCLLLDADCAWVSKQSPLGLINNLIEKCEFTGITEGVHDFDNQLLSDANKKYYFWADLDELERVYDLRKKIYQWRTEVLFFKKCPSVTNLFDTCRDVYKKCRHDLNTLRLFADHVPDELALNVAASINNIHPHQYKWKPSFWHRLHSENAPSIEQLQDQYYILSCGSNMTSPAVKKLYDRIVKSASYKLGMQHVFQLINKKEMMPARQQM